MSLVGGQLDPETAALIANADEVEAKRPDEPSLPPREWMKKNLFSSAVNSLLTVVFALFALFAYRSFLNWAFSENREWDAVRVNLRLLFSQAYPDENYTRVWVTMGIVAVLGGLSLGLMKVGQGISMKKLATWLLGWGGLIVLGVLLREPSVLKDAEGSPLLDAERQVIRESYGSAMSDRLGWWIIGIVLLVLGTALWAGLGDLRRRTTFVPAIPFGLAMLGLLISSLWWFNWGNYAFADGEFTFAPADKVAESTSRPWTWIFLLLVGCYLIGLALHKTNKAGTWRGLVNASWLLAPFVTFWAVLRGAVIDWDHVVSTDIPMFLAFALGGGALLWALTSKGIGETGRIIAVAVLLFAFYNWSVAFFSYDGIGKWGGGGSDSFIALRPIRWFFNSIVQPVFDPIFSGHFLDRFSDSWRFTHMLQKARLSFLALGLAALLAPNFIGEAKQRMRLVFAWIGFILLFQVLATVINTASSIDVPTEDFAGGFMITVYVAVFTMIFSFPLGVILALARTSKLPLFRMMSTIYIESFRGIPLITMLFFFTVFVNLFLPEGMELSGLAAVTVAFTLFSAAYLAENVRGGLQAIRRGQYEASDALGLTTVQRTMFIVLPQGLRVSIPPLVGQMIATFKETSLLAIVGIFDFLRIARDVIPNQPTFLGIRLEGLIFISAVYFVGAYGMSKYSQRLEKQLGVGER